MPATNIVLSSAWILAASFYIRGIYYTFNSEYILSIKVALIQSEPTIKDKIDEQLEQKFKDKNLTFKQLQWADVRETRRRQRLLEINQEQRKDSPENIELNKVKRKNKLEKIDDLKSIRNLWKSDDISENGLHQEKGRQNAIQPINSKNNQYKQ